MKKVIGMATLEHSLEKFASESSYQSKTQIKCSRKYMTSYPDSAEIPLA